MERTTFADGAVLDALAEFVPVAIDIEQQPATARQFQVQAVPAYCFLERDGTLLARGVGYLEPDKLATVLRELATDAREEGQGHIVSVDGAASTPLSPDS